MPALLSRRRMLAQAGLGLPASMAVAAVPAALRAQTAATPAPALMAEEIGRWDVPEANQAAAVDAAHFYGIGNRTLVKHRKADGARVAEWRGPPDGPIIHFNAGFVDRGRLVLAHSNFPNQPMASSVEVHDARTLQPLSSHSLGFRPGSLTWAVRRRGYWWACFANYNARGGTPGQDQRFTHVAQFNDQWLMLQSWFFPASVMAGWGNNSSSGGDWGDDGLLYVTGHDAPVIDVLRLPRQGMVLDHVTSIGVPIEGQGWAWDRSRRGERVIYGIVRAKRQIVAARLPGHVSP